MKTSPTSLLLFSLTLLACNPSPPQALTEESPHEQATDRQTSLKPTFKGYSSQVTTLSRDDERSSVLLIDMAHMGPVSFYQGASEALNSYMADKKSVALLSEGVNCSKTALSLRDQNQLWPFPTLQDLESKFNGDELSQASTGPVPQNLSSYVREYFRGKIAKSGTDAYFVGRECGPSEKGDDSYAEPARKLSKSSGVPTISQDDANNPMAQALDAWKKRNKLVENETADADMTLIDTSDVDQMIWSTMTFYMFYAPEEAEREEFAYLLGMWNEINDKGFRDEILLKSLQMSENAGTHHFIIPWGKAHHRDIEQRLKRLGYRTTSDETLPYASCDYIRLLTDSDSCTISN